MQCAEIAKKDEIVSLLKRVEVEGIQFLGPCNECEKRRKVVNGEGKKNERELRQNYREEKKETKDQEGQEGQEEKGNDENDENDEGKVNSREDNKEDEIDRDRECKDEEGVELSNDTWGYYFRIFLFLFSKPISIDRPHGPHTYRLYNICELYR